MLLAAAVLLTVGAIAFTLLVRERDLPQPEPKTGYEHLEERRARIYEGLRDLQFEFRVGKLSDEDYQRTKAALQTELAGVMAELDAAKGNAPKPISAQRSSVWQIRWRRPLVQPSSKLAQTPAQCRPHRIK